MVTYVKISDLPVATEATGDSELEVNQAGVTRRITVDQIADVIAEILPPPDMSDYATDEEVADAIAAIPDPAWNEITGKPATFPPTVPIAYSDISGTPTSLPPSGTAGGDLAGTYPNPLIKPGTNTQILTTVAGVAAWAAAPSSAPSGTAGGDLAGTYPNPTIKASVGLTGSPTSTTPTLGDPATRIVTIGYVTAALAAGASIAVGTTPPGSPSANALWWNSDASVGGGQMFIFYDGFWVPASPGVGSGAVVQTQSYQTGTAVNGFGLIPYDNTIPQITEGDEYMTLAVTPKSATSRLLIFVTLVASNSVANNLGVALFKDATANALAAGHMTCASAFTTVTVSFNHVMVSGTTSPITFRVRAGGSVAGTTTINAALYGGVMASGITIQEVL